MNPDRYLVMLYHRNALELYEQRWIDSCLDSLRQQTFQDFDVFELCYGDEPEQLWDGSVFIRRRVPTFVHAVNELLDIASEEYAGAFNIHLDDFYAPERFERQVAALQHYDLVSSNFYAVNPAGAVEHSYPFDKLNVARELTRGHNIICNPVVAFSRRWLLEAERFDPDACPVEDMRCWEANIEKMTMTVLPDYLCWKRMHPNEASMSEHR